MPKSNQKNDVGYGIFAVHFFIHNQNCLSNFMYQHIIEPFGAFEKHTFQDTHGNAFSTVPQYGSCLLDLKFHHQSVLDGYETADELIENKWAKNVILAPFPNRLRDGVYTHEGVMHSFPIKKSSGNNAIHGFCRDANMTVESVKMDADHAEMVCTHLYDADVHPAYPFRFLLKTVLTLRGATFTMGMYITNLDTKSMPVGMGWHPYFRFDGATASDISMQMPDCQLIVVDDRMLPTGEKVPFDDFKTLRQIKETRLDTGFVLKESAETNATVVLKFKNKKLKYWQNAQDWRFLQVFTPPHRDSVAVEPMSCAADAFNTGDGLKILMPKETFGGHFGVVFINA
jgi:aldose 1-epimerase